MDKDGYKINWEVLTYWVITTFLGTIFIILLSWGILETVDWAYS